MIQRLIKNISLGLVALLGLGVASSFLKATEAGTYAVSFKVEGTSNLDGVSENSIELAITSTGKDQLMAKINETNQYLEELGDEYLLIKERLTTELDNANLVLSNPLATDEEVNEALTNLTNALNKAKNDVSSVDNVIDLIDDIGNVTFKSKEKIDAARNAYEALDDELKVLVSNYQTLVNDETLFDVIDKIYNIGMVEYTSESEEKIKEAREAYDSLSDELKEQLGEEPLLLLVTAENQYKDLEHTANIIFVVFLIFGILSFAAAIYYLIVLLAKKNKNNTKMMSIAPIIPLFLASHFLDTRFIILYIILALSIIMWIVDIIIHFKKKK